MDFITTLDDLHSHYGTPGDASLRKVTAQVTPAYRAFIERARFCILSTVGPEGTDASPRGDEGPVAIALDDHTLALPDWHGNNRIDSLRNIVRDPRASLMFMIPGSTSVIRVNGHARVTADATLRRRFTRDGKQPRTVIVLAIDEVYFQCARALMRSALWDGRDDSAGLPTAGQILAGLTDGKVGGEVYDHEWPDRARNSMW